jgi:hypothetical protein
MIPQTESAPSAISQPLFSRIKIESPSEKTTGIRASDTSNSAPDEAAVKPSNGNIQLETSKINEPLTPMDTEKVAPAGLSLTDSRKNLPSKIPAKKWRRR